MTKCMLLLTVRTPIIYVLFDLSFLLTWPAPLRWVSNTVFCLQSLSVFGRFSACQCVQILTNPVRFLAWLVDKYWYESMISYDDTCRACVMANNQMGKCQLESISFGEGNALWTLSSKTSWKSNLCSYRFMLTPSLGIWKPLKWNLWRFRHCRLLLTNNQMGKCQMESISFGVGKLGASSVQPLSVLIHVTSI